MKNSPVVHFEMPTKNNARVSKFYTEVFGWQMLQLGREMGNYLLATTTPTDQNQMVQNPGEINGGFFEWKNEEGFNSPHVVIQVDNLEKYIEKVKKTGGMINGKPMDIPGVGKYISFKDSEDNIVGMLQPYK